MILLSFGGGLAVLMLMTLCKLVLRVVTSVDLFQLRVAPDSTTTEINKVLQKLPLPTGVGHRPLSRGEER